MTAPSTNCRALAAKVLAPIFRSEKSLQHTFDAAIDRVNDTDKAFFHKICFGCLREYEWIDGVTSELIEKPLRNKDFDIKALIFIGIYQLHYLSTPDHAAISETVAAVEPLKKRWAKNLVNAVLRQFQRDKVDIEHTLLSRPDAQARCPAWLLGKLKKQWPESWQTIVAANAQQAPLTVRVNAARLSRDKLCAELISSGLDVQQCTHSDVGLKLGSVSDIDKMQWLTDGNLSVQDEAAQLAASVLAPKAGQRVLDACAAPGGKTCHILEYQPEIASLLALDNDSERSQRIEQNLKRLKLEAKITIAEAQNLDAWWDGRPFDCILLDAPCSATGVIRRHPDIKLLRQADDIAKLAEIQFDILSALWQTLAVGGTLVYATCSILKTENEQVIRRFLEAEDSARHDPIEATWGLECAFGRQLFPTVDAHDGFYYARVKKNSFVSDYS